MPVVMDTTMPTRELMRFMDSLKAYTVYRHMEDAFTVSFSRDEDPSYVKVQISMVDEVKGQKLVRRLTKRLGG